MAKKTRRTPPSVSMPTPFEEARDELFQHVMRCGVTGSDPEHQREWFDETFTYLRDRYPELRQAELAELRTLGERFAQPARKQAQTADAPAA